MFEQAKSNLDSIPYVGLVEHWEDSLEMLKYYFDLTPIVSMHQNKGITRQFHQVFFIFPISL